MTRNPSQFLVEQIKLAGYDRIHPGSSLRFIRALLPQLPRQWQSLNSDALVKKVRQQCEMAVSANLLTRKRMNGITGYVYFVVA
ncbi:hypothetical protein IC617_08480 [Neiella sp. HB171785]|uniref:Uncharacterized protein n=1 Tax=Neiella litorisoli TaxID=2771431 RepID=A0A8J6UG14_9GAMM|nr:hypothetical protein [Neiella litorisoli]MBD1389461.1 hypothetical protein [Neiella litorisoli]